MNIITKVFILSETRDDMAKLFRGIGAEIGVADGDYAQYILNENPGVRKLYGVDVYKPHKDYRDYTRESTFNGMLEHAREKVTPFGDKHEFIFKFSMDAVHDFEDDSLDFVYIDANHNYKHCSEDIREWSKKVRSGGIVSGDDYVRRKNQDEYYDVVRAVDDYVEEFKIPELFLYRGKKPTNWMFYKP